MTPTFAEAARFWLRLGWISFGGPAGQIAIMHREVVERERWLDEKSFTDALNFCMLLPGPEALQLAIYLGWKLHGMRGGLVAGLGFVVPSILILLGLSWIYARFGSVPAVEGVLLGLKACVVALVLQALVKIGRRALKGPLHLALAVGAFVLLEWLKVPFPLIVLGAGLLGVATARAAAPPALPVADSRTPHSPWPVLIGGIVLWGLPLLAVVTALGGDSLWTRLYLFFTQAALVTFGGAYAVLGYVTQHLVHGLGWVTAEQSVAGLALAETTPGPLIMVLQFLGFMAGWNQPAPLSPEAGALIAALLAAWATFLPSFVFIFVGAPYVEPITRNPRASGALAAITAAVVGIIAALTLLVARVVLWPGGPGTTPNWVTLAIAVASWFALQRTRVDLPWILAGAALAGWLATGFS